MVNQKFTAEFEDPIELTPGQWQCAYRIRNQDGVLFGGNRRTAEVCSSIDCAIAEAAYQAEVDIAALEGVARPQRPDR